MRVSIIAIGRLRKGPELDLIDDYRTRFDRTGRALGLGPLTITQLEDRKGGGMDAEARLIDNALPKGAWVCAMDERGEVLTSPKFARKLADRRDGGTSDFVFLIGGADGLDQGLRARADARLSLGSMVWPHMLARVMLCEQLYRAASILAGAPYHRA